MKIVDIYLVLSINAYFILQIKIQKIILYGIAFQKFRRKGLKY